MNITFEPTIKQDQAWEYLNDDITLSILYGGSVSCGKSYIGCMWIIINCIRFPGVRYLMGRARLSILKKTTLKTFTDLCTKFKIDININNQNNIITFNNGSEVLLFDLYDYPADPEYTRLGSLEITGAFIDELAEISYKGFQVVQSRLRYKLTEYNIYPKIFCCSNPTNGWPKNFFYLPYKNISLPSHVKFIEALPTDNKYNNKNYLASLEKTLDSTLKNILLYGNWDFSASDYDLFEYEKITQCFYNDFFVNVDNKYYITADIAELGKDKTIIGVWRGWNLIKVVKLEKKDPVQVAEEINKIRTQYQVNINNIIVDATGVGSGVAAILKGCVRYMAASKALDNGGYKNIKAQLMYKFAEKINNLELNFNMPFDEILVQELVFYKKVYKENIAGITSKDEIKAKLNRSPDMADSLYLRAYWEFNQRSTYIRVR